MENSIQDEIIQQKNNGKIKFKELSNFWKVMIIVLVITTIVSISLAIWYFMTYIYPLLGIMGV